MSPLGFTPGPRICISKWTVYLSVSRIFERGRAPEVLFVYSAGSYGTLVWTRILLKYQGYSRR